MLDESQLAFTIADSERIRLLAPAGSGKTSALLQRCARISQEAPNERFLFITFTLAAKNELMARLQRDDSLKHAAGSIRISTLNAWGNRQVRQSVMHAQLLASKSDRRRAMNNALQPVWQQYPRIAAALSGSNRYRVADALFSTMESLKSLGFRHDQVSESSIRRQVRWLKDAGMDAQLDAVLEPLREVGLASVRSLLHQPTFMGEMMDDVIPFWSDATRQLRAQALITFEDQKYWPLLAMSERGAKRLSGAARTHHVVVDEFQDINPLDLRLIRAIATQNDASITLAGDDDQAIFEWRGASPEFILNPGEYLGGDFDTFILSTNYRSPRNIVEMSQALISNNSRRVAKTVTAHMNVEAEVAVLRYPSVSECIQQTTALVGELLKRDGIDSVALVSRKRSQIVPYQVVFAGAELSFYAAEDLNINLSKAFEDLKQMLYIRGSFEHPSPFGPSAVEMVLSLSDKVKKYPISKADRSALLAHLTQTRPRTVPDVLARFQEYRGPLKGDNADGRMTDAFAKAIAKFLLAPTVAEAVRTLSTDFAGLQQDYAKSDDDIFYTDPPFFYLAGLAESYGNDFGAFFSDISGAMDRLAQVHSEATDEVDHEQLDARLHLMTALRAKGREFDAVVILDANDEIWPIRHATTDRKREQERRLFYVATTRARKFIAFVLSDELLGARLKPSPYLCELGLVVPE
jgi:DNA helicase-2/ATP-dependent DNA helicase PcrA